MKPFRRLAVAIGVVSALLLPSPMPANAATPFVITTYAGTGTSGFSGDGGPASSAKLQEASSLAFDRSGNMYFADGENQRVRKITPAGTISTIAGTGTAGSSGDGGMATSAQLQWPLGVAVDLDNNIYITGEGARIRKIDANGIISTFAGTGTQGYAGDGGLATSAQLGFITSGITVDLAGTVYFSDTTNSVVRKINKSGTISAFAGNGTSGFSGNGGAATSAQLNSPYSVTADHKGNVYILDSSNSRIRKIDSSGIITTFGGTGTAGFSGDGGAATSAKIKTGVVVDSTITHIVGFSQVAVDTTGAVYLGDTGNYRVRRIATSGIINTIAGTGTNTVSGDGGDALAATIGSPSGVAPDPSGNVYIWSGARIRKVALVGNPYAFSNASVSIDPSLSFTVGGHSGSCNGVTQSAGSVSDATSVSLGHVSSSNQVNGAQDLTLGTNSGNSATVYVRYASALNDGNGHTIADIATSNASPGGFPSTGTASFGYTISDSALGTGTANRFTNPSAQWAALTTGNAEVQYLSGSTKTTCIDYQVGVSDVTPAGSFTTSVIYTAIANF